jgi:eukaryotic-like serine/threonine-protein kinase
VRERKGSLQPEAVSVEVERWHLQYLATLDEGARLTPREFARDIPPGEVRDAVLRRLLLFERTFEALAHARPPGTDVLPAIPGYVVEREIGRGGFGTVYFARSPRFPNGVAIKLIPLAGASARIVRRFIREFWVSAAVRHRSVVRVFDLGELPASLYIAMEWIDGLSLAEIVAALRHEDPEVVARTPVKAVLERAWSSVGREPGVAIDSTDERTWLDWVVDTVEALARGLAVAHRCGIVHRDVSPSNVMIRASDASPVLLDFGLARREGSAEITGTGDLFGKPQYVAPEWARRLQIGSSTSADVYSLSVVLYELATLRRPFDGRSTREILERIVKRTPASMRRLNRAISHELESVASFGLEKDPRRRLPSAQDLADDLDRVRRGERPVSWPRRRARVLRRFGRRAAVGSLAALAVYITSFVLWRAFHTEKSTGRSQSALHPFTYRAR